MSNSDLIMMLLAAGIPPGAVGGMDAMTIFLLSGKILNDKELTTRALEMQEDEVHSIPRGERLKVLCRMSEDEKAELRARIGV